MERSQVEKIMKAIIEDKLNEINALSCSSNEFSKGEGFILTYLHKFKDKDVTAGELANELKVSTPRITAALSSLEKKSLIIKEKCPKDNRITFVKITEIGNNLIISKYNEMIDDVQELINIVGDDDINELLRILVKVKAATLLLRSKKK